MENMELYNAFRVVPDQAKRQIQGGKLKGMTDINPMWRIEALTERFGACGKGWKYVILNKYTLPGADGEVLAFVDIDLYYRIGSDWSEAVPGTGGSKLIQLEKGKLVSNDEAFKMALTDAISVAAKSLGVGADVYYAAGRTKYSQTHNDEETPVNVPESVTCARCGKVITGWATKNKTFTASEIIGNSKIKYGDAHCFPCMMELKDKENG